MWLKKSLVILWVATCALFTVTEAASINPCGPETSICGDGSCIPKDKLCNGKEDCPRGEDERYCTEWWADATSSSCSPDEFTCHDGKCIPSQYRCDGYRDCQQGEDEYNCGQTEYTTGYPTTRDPMTSRDPSPMTTRDPYVECLHPFDTIGGKCILIDPVVESTWHESRYLCQRLDADLVLLDSLDSYGDLVSFLQQNELNTRDYWVGASDEAVEGVWMWVNYQMVRNGTPLWALYGSGSSYYQEPRSEYASSRDCGYLDRERFYYMDDSDCTEKRAVICEKFLYHETSISEDKRSNIKILEPLEQKTQDTQSYKSSPEDSPVEEKEVEGNYKGEHSEESQVKEAQHNQHVEAVIKEMQEKFLQSALGQNKT